VGETIGLLGMLDTTAKEYIRERPSGVSSAKHAKQGWLAGYVHSNRGHGSGKAWLEFFGKDLKERRVRYVTALAAKMFSRIPAFMKDTHEINSYAARRYQVRPYLGRLTLFRAANQADDNILFDNGWAPIFKEGIEVHNIPGDHWQVLSEPGIDVLAKSIGDCLSTFDEPSLV